MDKTSTTSFLTTAFFHGALLFLPGFSISFGENETYILHEITLVPVQALTSQGGKGLPGLTRPGAKSAAQARVALRQKLVAQQKALEARMSAIQSGARRDIRDNKESASEFADGLKTQSEADPMGLSREGPEGSAGALTTSNDPAQAGTSDGQGVPMLAGGAGGRRIISKIEAEYPSRAREQGIDGEGVVIFTVLESGMVMRSSVRTITTSGHRDMDHAFMQAVSEWVFVAVPVGTGAQRYRLPFNYRFRLERP